MQIQLVNKDIQQSFQYQYDIDIYEIILIKCYEFCSRCSLMYLTQGTVEYR